MANICNLHPESDIFMNGKCICCHNEMKLKQRNKKLDKIYQHLSIVSNIPARYRHAALDSALIDYSIQQKAINCFKANPYSNFLLVGKTGTGKTHFGCALIHHLISQQEYTDEQFADFDDRRIENMKSDYRYIKFYQLTDLKIKDYSSFLKILNCKMLVIDEVANNFSEFKQALLFEIIDARYDEMLPTTLITNLEIKQFAPMLSDALKSRLHNHVMLEFDIKDYRKEQE